jgi:hypothetical protein
MLPTAILGLVLATCSFICGTSTDMSAVLAPDERRSRLFGMLTACALGLLIAIAAQ